MADVLASWCLCRSIRISKKNHSPLHNRFPSPTQDCLQPKSVFPIGQWSLAFSPRPLADNFETIAGQLASIQDWKPKASLLVNDLLSLFSPVIGWENQVLVSSFLLIGRLILAPHWTPGTRSWLADESLWTMPSCESHASRDSSACEHVNALFTQEQIHKWFGVNSRFHLQWGLKTTEKQKRFSEQIFTWKQNLRWPIHWAFSAHQNSAFPLNANFFWGHIAFAQEEKNSAMMRLMWNEFSHEFSWFWFGEFALCEQGVFVNT